MGVLGIGVQKAEQKEDIIDQVSSQKLLLGSQGQRKEGRCIPEALRAGQVRRIGSAIQAGTRTTRVGRSMLR